MALVAVVGLAGCWLQPGFDSERGGFNPSDGAITPTNVAGVHPVWTATVGGPGVTDPTVSTDAVYVTAGGVQNAGTVFALNRSNGTSRWTATLFPAGLNGLAELLPTTLANGAVYVPVGDSHGGTTDVFDPVTGAARQAIPEPAYEVIAHDSRLVGTFKPCQASTGGVLCETMLKVYDTAGTGTWYTLLDTTSGAVVTSPAVSPTRAIIGRNANVQSWLLAPPTNCTY